jgi:hypothetical protein
MVLYDVYYLKNSSYDGFCSFVCLRDMFIYRAHYNRALVYAEQRLTEKALEDADAVLKINPKISEVWTLRGW